MSEAAAPLARLVEAVRRAEGRADRGEAVRAWMLDREAVSEAAKAGASEVDAYLTALEGLPGMTAAAGRVRRALAAAAKGSGPLRVVGAAVSRPGVEVDGERYDLPGGYYVAPDGSLLRDQGEQGAPIVVAHRVMVVTRRWVEQETGREVVDLAWADGAGWRTETVPRGTVMDARAVVGLADLGAPVSSVSSGEVVRYLRAQVEGLDSVPGVAVSQCGWVGRDFVAGLSTVLGGSEVRVVADEGARQIARGLGVAGSWDGWREAIGKVSHRELVMVAIYGAVAAMMLRPLGVQGGIVLHWTAGSSQGKTTTLRVGASVAGHPMAAGWVGSWDATIKKIEEQAAFCRDLPTMLDETSHIAANAREGAARLVYALASGRGRGRGTRGGSDAVAEYRTVALSTGEAPLTSWCGQDGIAARVLEMTGAPCESAEQSQELVWALSEHYGHLAVKVVRWLAGQEWAELRTRYRARVSHWGAQATGGGVGARLGELVALLEVAAHVCRALGVPGDHAAVILWVWRLSQAQAAGADEGARALEVLRSQLAQHADQIQRDGVSYLPGAEDDGKTASGRCVARDLGEGWTAVSSVVAEEWWARAGLDPAAMRQRWQDRGWYHRGKIRLMGQPVAVLKIHESW